MKLPAKAEYALRAVLQLGASAGPPVSSATIARDQDISRRFLEEILTDLRHDGVVESVRGGHGGYRLARHPDDVSVADVFAATQLTYVDRSTACDGGDVVAHLWAAFEVDVTEFFESVTIGDLLTGQLPGWAATLAERADPDTRLVS